MNKLLTILAYIYASTIGVFGYTLCLLSKLIRSFGYLCMLKVNSARSELIDFLESTIRKW